MKNYNEMANNVLRRIEEHETNQRNRRKVLKKIIIPVCCFCLVAILGIGIWQSDFLKKTPAVELDDSTAIGQKDYIEPDENNPSSYTGDVIGMVKYNGEIYAQNTTTTKTYTPNEYLGEASDFEGTYQRYLSETSGGLYNAKEDPNVLMVEINHDEYTSYVILFKEETQ